MKPKEKNNEAYLPPVCTQSVLTTQFFLCTSNMATMEDYQEDFNEFIW